MDAREHWGTVYRTKRADDVSWFQREPTLSLDLIRRVAPDPATRIIDVGAGTSTLVDGLLREGYESISVLDIADEALAQSRARLGARAAAVEWLVGDVRTIELPEAAYDVWHDRAVFHFLTDRLDRAAYVAQVRRAVRPGGYLLVATFAEDGPQKCSGLAVARYSVPDLHREFGEPFELIESVRELHTTPSGAQQAFVYCRWRNA